MSICKYCKQLVDSEGTRKMTPEQAEKLIEVLYSIEAKLEELIHEMKQK